MSIPCQVERVEECLGGIELESIAKGFEVTDAMLKAAPVEVVFSSPTSPGYYLVLVTGDVESVRSALRRGEDVAKAWLRSSLFLPHVHKDVLDSLYRIRPFEGELEAIGILESHRQLPLVVASDKARKAAEVYLLHIHLGIGIGGHSFSIFLGDFEEVEASLEAGKSYLEEKGALKEEVFIGRADPGMLEVLLTTKLPERSSQRKI